MMKAEKKEVRDSPKMQQSLPTQKRPIPQIWPNSLRASSSRRGEQKSLGAKREELYLPGNRHNIKPEKYPLLRSSGRA